MACHHWTSVWATAAALPAQVRATAAAAPRSKLRKIISISLRRQAVQVSPRCVAAALPGREAFVTAPRGRPPRALRPDVRGHRGEMEFRLAPPGAQHILRVVKEADTGGVVASAGAAPAAGAPVAWGRN